MGRHHIAFSHSLFGYAFRTTDSYVGDPINSQWIGCLSVCSEGAFL